MFPLLQATAKQRSVSISGKEKLEISLRSIDKLLKDLPSLK
jgi:hypothetical protein